VNGEWFFIKEAEALDYYNDRKEKIKNKYDPERLHPELARKYWPAMGQLLSGKYGGDAEKYLRI
jgi:hypothetical protein